MCRGSGEVHIGMDGQGHGWEVPGEGGEAVHVSLSQTEPSPPLPGSSKQLEVCSCKSGDHLQR